MSTFRVTLHNSAQGTLDTSNHTQRTVSITGPNGMHRNLSEGDTFVDSNYFKRFCYPQVSLADAILEVVEDDGTTYSDSGNNNYLVTWKPGDDGSITAGDTYDDTNMSLDIVDTYGGYATFLQIRNSDSTQDIQVRLNGNSDSVFTVVHGSTQVFNAGDINASSIAFDNSFSGNGAVDTVEVLLGVNTVSNS